MGKGFLRKDWAGCRLSAIRTRCKPVVMEWTATLDWTRINEIAQWLAAAVIAVAQLAIFLKDRSRLMARRLDSRRSRDVLAIQFEPVQASATHRCTVRAMTPNLILLKKRPDNLREYVESFGGKVPAEHQYVELELTGGARGGRLKAGIRVYSIDGKATQAQITVHCPHSWRPIRLITNTHKGQ